MPDIFSIAEGKDEPEYDPYYWHDMPEFHQPKKEEYHLLYVRFRNEEDLQEFAKLLDQTITKNTKSIWYPKLDRFQNSLLRYIDEEEIENYELEE